MIPPILPCHVAAGLALLAVSLSRRDGKATRVGALAAGLFMITGLLPSVMITARLPGLLGTAYGFLVAAKLLLALLAVAIWHAGRHKPSSVTRFGLLLAAVSASVGLLAWAPAGPAQPVWPLPWTLSLDSFHTDAVFRIELLRALPWLAVAVLLLAAAAAPWRRLWPVRWGLLAASLATLWLTMPDLSPLVVPATPTAYYRSTTRFAAAAILRGEAVYRAQCVGCHGAAGRGDGVLAAGLQRPPADLTADHLWMHSDGELFWWLSHGIAAPDGATLMPGTGGSLASDDVWSVIDYIRGRNAGTRRARTGSWSPTMLAPDLKLTCDGGRARRLSDLKGHPVRVVIGAAPAVGSDVMTVLITDTPATAPDASTCVADAGLAPAYAIAAGLAPQEANSAQFLIDRDGWLRAIQQPRAQEGWNDRAQLEAALWLLASAPVIGDTSVCHAPNAPTDPR